MSKPLGSVLDGTFFFFKAGALADPTPLPTVISCTKPDGTAVPPPALSHVAAGVFYAAQLFSAVDTATLTGYYSAFAETSDATVDNPMYGVDWEVEGSSSDPLLSTVPGTYPVDSAGYNLGQIPGIKAKTDGLDNSGQATVTSPVAQNLDITIYEGDDYHNGHSRSFPFTLTGAPSIAGGSVKLRIIRSGGNFEKVGVVTSATTCYVELDDTETATITPTTYVYRLIATLSDGDICTVVEGNFTVK